ncbi:hypothetical protein JG687_00017244 [Phytophthora cactorum]|uniref:Uncharacterized protein n=1 Tax=Phytophthora cactorum TaxID=29920 RepID=A0A8T1TNS3_9STRA|nr:hypothetical protein JG687_00017244 [Phytophthora cactorum]
MNFCTTRPPNSHHMRDDVIGIVNQRTRVVHAASSHHDETRLKSAEKKIPRKRGIESVVEILSFKSTGKAQPPQKGISSQAEDLVLLILEDQAKQRKLRRDRQQGHRQRQNDLVLTLTKETVQLREEIQVLEERRSAIVAAAPTQEYV